MSAEPHGFIARMVDRSIRRTVRRGLHSVHWIGPPVPLTQPAIVVPNHHGWHDGLVMYLALAELGVGPTVSWVAETDACPSWEKVGGMPFPSEDVVARAQTIRRTARLLKEQRQSVLLFAEGALHKPGKVLPFAKSLEFLAGEAPEAVVIPVGIRYEQAMHEQPECFLLFGRPIDPGPDLGLRTRLAVAALLDEVAGLRITAPERFSALITSGGVAR